MNLLDIRTKVTKVINEWNPYSLLPEAPADEFECEIGKIVNIISSTKSCDELGIAIKDIFTNSFGEDFTIEECTRIASKIINSIG